MEGESLVGRASIGCAWGTVLDGAGVGAPGIAGVGVNAPDEPGAQGSEEPGRTVPVEQELQGDPPMPPIRLGPSMYIAEQVYWL